VKTISRLTEFADTTLSRREELRSLLAMNIEDEGHFAFVSISIFDGFGQLTSLLALSGPIQAR